MCNCVKCPFLKSSHIIIMHLKMHTWLSLPSFVSHCLPFVSTERTSWQCMVACCVLYQLEALSSGLILFSRDPQALSSDLSLLCIPQPWALQFTLDLASIGNLDCMIFHYYSHVALNFASTLAAAWYYIIIVLIKGHIMHGI